MPTAAAVVCCYLWCWVGMSNETKYIKYIKAGGTYIALPIVVALPIIAIVVVVVVVVVVVAVIGGGWSPLPCMLPPPWCTRTPGP